LFRDYTIIDLYGQQPLLIREQLSEKEEIAPQYLYRLETGRRVLSLDTVVALAATLNTTQSALLAEPQPDEKGERISRVAAIFRALPESDAACHILIRSAVGKIFSEINVEKFLLFPIRGV
jgi:transcriptional regulator with XRE-family HTH domain